MEAMVDCTTPILRQAPKHLTLQTIITQEGEKLLVPGISRSWKSLSLCVTCPVSNMLCLCNRAYRQEYKLVTSAIAQPRQLPWKTKPSQS